MSHLEERVIRVDPLDQGFLRSHLAHYEAALLGLKHAFEALAINVEVGDVSAFRGLRGHRGPAGDLNGFGDWLLPDVERLPLVVP